MGKSVSYLFVLLVVVALLLAWMGATAAPQATNSGPTERVSIRSNGDEGNKDSFAADISADGRYVVFESDAGNLVSGDNNGFRDIFVHDRQTHTTKRVSVRTGGQEANSDSYAPAISDDGRIVVFHSYATNLVDGDTNNVPDVFFHNRDTGKTKLVSVVVNGAADDLSLEPDISADGRYVVFQSFATNLVADDTNGMADIFRYDRINKVMERVSLDSNEAQANGNSRRATISADGMRIVFESDASNLVAGDNGIYTDIFLRNMSDTTTQRVSVSDDEAEAQGDSSEPFIAGNGVHVVFSSLANNLVSGDNNGFPDVFMRNTAANNTKLISVASDETQANNWSFEASITADGRYVAFQSRATNLVAGDPDIARDVFVRDRQAGTTVRASVDSSGNIGNASSRAPVIAANGRFIAFESKASNLVSGDGNNARDIFVHDLVTPVPPRPPATLTVNYDNGAPGSYFAFSGSNYAANSAFELWINGVLISDTLSTDGNGDLAFVIRTLSAPGGTAPGGYFATVIQGSTKLTAGFMVHTAAATRPVSGNGPIFDLPGNVNPYDQLIYLPVARRN